MIGTLTSLSHRVVAVLGRVSMYRLVLMALSALAVIALVLSAFGVFSAEPLITPAPLELLATAAVLVVVCAAADAGARRVLGLSWRLESSLITAGILLFILRPTVEPLGLLGIAVAAAVASLSKYVIAWRGRHILNPASAGAAGLAVLSIVAPDLGTPSWWVGTPAMALPVIIAGLAVLWRTEKVRIVLVFLVAAVAVAVLRVSVQSQAAGFAFDLGTTFWQLLWSSPFLFLGAFMLSEPLTLPPRRWQQFTVALVVGVLAGWPISLGAISLGQERALLIGNLVAFALAFSARAAVRLRLERRADVTPTVRQLEFRVSRPLSFAPGQYLEIDVPHRHADARGTRREFSIASAPADLPLLRIAYKDNATGKRAVSSFKRALAAVPDDGALSLTGIWGDFVLPKRTDSPLLLVAAGIGITPFVSQLRQLRLAGEDRDIVLVYVASEASELAFREDLEQSGVPVIVFTRDRPADLPRTWMWAQGVRLDADGLQQVVPDLAARHTYISGPPALIADLAPALEKSRSLTTDAFSGY